MCPIGTTVRQATVVPLGVRLGSRQKISESHQIVGNETRPNSLSQGVTKQAALKDWHRQWQRFTIKWKTRPLAMW